MEINRVATPGQSPAKSKLESQDEKQLLNACKEFEAIMLQQMMKSMRATVPKSETSKSFGQEISQDMYDEKLTDEMAKSGGIGLAQVLFQQMNGKIRP